MTIMLNAICSWVQTNAFVKGPALRSINSLDLGVNRSVAHISRNGVMATQVLFRF